MPTSEHVIPIFKNKYFQNYINHILINAFILEMIFLIFLFFYLSKLLINIDFYFLKNINIKEFFLKIKKIILIIILF